MKLKVCQQEVLIQQRCQNKRYHLYLVVLHVVNSLGVKDNVYVEVTPIATFMFTTRYPDGHDIIVLTKASTDVTATRCQVIHIAALGA